MKRKEIILIVSILLGIFSVITLTLLSTSIVYAEGFTLTSDDIGGQLSEEQVLNMPEYGCDGENISPHLRWVNPPDGTQSFAVTVHDPDAPTGSGWWHWVIFNIPRCVRELEAGAGNEGGSAPRRSIQSLTDSGMSGYNGACPPAGDRPHRYIFTVYALDTDDLVEAEGLGRHPESCPPGLVGFALNMHTIAKAALIAYYAIPAE